MPVVPSLQIFEYCHFVNSDVLGGRENGPTTHGGGGSARSLSALNASFINNKSTSFENNFIEINDNDSTFNTIYKTGYNVAQWGMGLRDELKNNYGIGIMESNSFGGTDWVSYNTNIGKTGIQVGVGTSSVDYYDCLNAPTISPDFTRAPNKSDFSINCKITF